MPFPKKDLQSKLIPARWTPIREAQGIGLTGERLRLYDSNIRFAVIPAGRLSTKTELMARRKLVEELPADTPYDDARYVYLAPTLKQAKLIVWRAFEKLIPEYWLAEKSKSELMFTTKWGATLEVHGGDRPERIEGGVPLSGFVGDECANWKPGTWEEHIFPMLSARNGWARLIGVPDYLGQNAEGYKKLCDYAKLSGDPEWGFFHWTSEDILSADEIETQKRNLSPFQYDQEIRGLWVKTPGSAYYTFSKELHVRNVEYDDMLPLHVSCDFNRGYHNWGIYQVASPNETRIRNTYRVIDQVFKENATVSDMCGVLQRKLDNLGEYTSLHFYGDYSGDAKTATSSRTAWRQIKDAFPNASYHYKPQGSVADRIDAVNAALKNAAGDISVMIDPKCTELINDLEYVTTVMLLTQNKGSRLTHASDAFGYFLRQYPRIADAENITANQLRSLQY